MTKMRQYALFRILRWYSNNLTFLLHLKRSHHVLYSKIILIKYIPLWYTPLYSSRTLANWIGVEALKGNSPLWNQHKWHLHRTFVFHQCTRSGGRSCQRNLKERGECKRQKKSALISRLHHHQFTVNSTNEILTAANNHDNYSSACQWKLITKRIITRTNANATQITYRQTDLFVPW